MDSDKVLVNKFLKGEEQAFNILVRKYQKSIYWQSRRMVGNHLDADEITQQVIITIYEKLKTFRFNSTLKTWIYSITQRKCINFLKKRNLKRFLALDNSSVMNNKNETDIILNTEDKEKLDKLSRILASVPVKQRQVFTLRHFEELSYEEISEITGKSIGGLKANYFHAMKKIIKEMENEK